MTLSEVYPEDQKVVYIKIGTTGKVFLSISTLNRHIIPRAVFPLLLRSNATAKQLLQQKQQHLLQTLQLQYSCL